MQLYKHADGSVTVDQFDDEIEITRELLNVADPAVMAVSQDRMHVMILGEDYYAIRADARTVTYLRGYLKVPTPVE